MYVHIQPVVRLKMWEDSFVELILSYLYMDSRDWTPAVRLLGQVLYQLSYLAGSRSATYATWLLHIIDNN